MPVAAAASHHAPPPTRAYTIGVLHQEAQVPARTVYQPCYKNPWEPGFPASLLGLVPALPDFLTECHGWAFREEFLNPHDCRNTRVWQSSPPFTHSLAAILLSREVPNREGHQDTGKLFMSSLLDLCTPGPGSQPRLRTLHVR